MNLTEFAQEHPNHRGTKCWLGSLPELDEVETAHKNGIGPSLIIKWLIEDKGYPERQVTMGKVTSHLYGHKGRSYQD